MAEKVIVVKEPLPTRLVAVTNTSRQGRVFRAASGAIVRFPPGATVEVELTEPQIKRYNDERGKYDEKVKEWRPVLSVGEVAKKKASEADADEEKKLPPKKRGRR